MFAGGGFVTWCGTGSSWAGIVTDTNVGRDERDAEAAMGLGFRFAADSRLADGFRFVVLAAWWLGLDDDGMSVAFTPTKRNLEIRVPTESLFDTGNSRSRHVCNRISREGAIALEGSVLCY